MAHPVYNNLNRFSSTSLKTLASDVVLVAREEQVHDNVINDVIDEQLQAATTSATTQYTSVDEWLTDIKMHRYRENFARCGYTHANQLKQLTRRDLTTTLGVSLVGHQKKILNSVQALRTGDHVDTGRTPRSIDPLLD